MSATPPICENCVKGNVLPGTPTGSITHVDKYLSDVYLASRATKPAADGKKKAIVFLTDIFGLPLVNCKIMADGLNEKVGVDVYVPDLFNGSPPFTVDTLAPFVGEKAGDTLSMWSKVKFVGVAITHITALYPNRPSVVNGRAEAFVRALHGTGEYADIGVAGYCLGGGCAAHVASLDIVKTSVIAHPSPLSAETVRKFKGPSFWACAEDDKSTAEPIRLEFQKILEEKESTKPVEFKVYKGTAHGFAARPNLKIPAVKEGYEESFQDTVAFFQRTL